MDGMLSNWKITSILLEREWAKYEPGKPPSLDIFHSVMVKYTTALVVITIFIRFLEVLKTQGTIKGIFSFIDMFCNGSAPFS